MRSSEFIPRRRLTQNIVKFPPIKRCASVQCDTAELTQYGNTPLTSCGVQCRVHPECRERATSVTDLLQMTNAAKPIARTSQSSRLILELEQTFYEKAKENNLWLGNTIQDRLSGWLKKP